MLIQSSLRFSDFKIIAQNFTFATGVQIILTEPNGIVCHDAISTEGLEDLTQIDRLSVFYEISVEKFENASPGLNNMSTYRTISCPLGVLLAQGSYKR